MKIKEIFLTFITLFILTSQSTFAKIKVPATLLMQIKENGYSKEKGLFNFEGALYGNCNSLDCFELSTTLIKVTNLNPSLYGPSEDIHIKLTGESGQMKLNESFQLIKDLRREDVYKSLPWSQKIKIDSYIDSNKLLQQFNYSGNSVLHVIVL